MPRYSRLQQIKDIPRLPLAGSLDLTYRCNNNCRHCWVRIPAQASERHQELSLDEIKAIVDEARKMGCRKWSISGGEPMLRPDFPEIFDYLTRKALSYTLNTNGTLITPEIAQLLKRKGSKMIALYGATAEVYDAVTRHPGAFEDVMRGFENMRQAGAGFIVQLIPMARTGPSGRRWLPWQNRSARTGASARPGSGCRPTARRDAIEKSPGSDCRRARSLNWTNPILPMRNGWRNCPATALGWKAPQIPTPVAGASLHGDDRLFARCIAGRRDFHVDPYGRMTFCSFVKDPALRYDLRQGTFHEAWEEFIPACADKVHGSDEWRAHCGACEKRSDCRWCAVYAYLETGRYAAPIPYLCAVVEEARKFKANWQTNHRRYFKIAGITVRVESDLDFDEIQFKPEFAPFAAEGPGDDNVTFRHHFELPDLKGKDLGKEIYRKAPWAISRKNGTWFYQGISTTPDDPELHRVAVFNADHTRATIYSPPRDAEHIRDQRMAFALPLSDRPDLARAACLRTAARCCSMRRRRSSTGRGCFSSVIRGGQIHDDDAVKKRCRRGERPAPLHVEILCDDRNIVRRWEEGWRVHGTWSHGDVADVSSASAPLARDTVFRQDTRNKSCR